MGLYSWHSAILPHQHIACSIPAQCMLNTNLLIDWQLPKQPNSLCPQNWLQLQRSILSDDGGTGMSFGACLAGLHAHSVSHTSADNATCYVGHHELLQLTAFMHLCCSNHTPCWCSSPRHGRTCGVGAASVVSTKLSLQQRIYILDLRHCGTWGLSCVRTGAAAH